MVDLLNNSSDVLGNLDGLFGFDNPKLPEYQSLIDMEEGNSLAWMGQSYVSPWQLDLPPMLDGDYTWLFDGALLDFHSADDQLTVLKNAIDRQITWDLEVLPDYEASVRLRWRKLHERYERSAILHESDDNAVRAYNELVCNFNADLSRIIEEDDVQAVSTFYQAFCALLAKRRPYDSTVTEEFFRSRLQGGVLVDAGGGGGGMFEFAKRFGVSTYVNVDRFPNTQGALDSTNPLDFSHIGGILVVRFKADMLDFLARLQPGSVHVTMNGIDKDLIPNSDYHYAIARELERVIQPGGVLFGYNAEALHVCAERFLDVDAALAGKERPLRSVKSMNNGTLRIFENKPFQGFPMVS